MQQLAVQLTIPIPADQVLISKVEFEKLKQQSLSGVYWTMKDLEQRTNKKVDWIKENILYPTRFREILDVQNGGFVYYPQGKGQSWAFHGLKMSEFLDKCFGQIFAD